jgi:hypothetical protein
MREKPISLIFPCNRFVALLAVRTSGVQRGRGKDFTAKEATATL